MKSYIKPNTEIHEIELVQMIAGSPDEGLKRIDPSTAVSDVNLIESKSSDVSFWGDSAEEE